MRARHARAGLLVMLMFSAAFAGCFGENENKTGVPDLGDLRVEPAVLPGGEWTTIVLTAEVEAPDNAEELTDALELLTLFASSSSCPVAFKMGKNFPWRLCSCFCTSSIESPEGLFFAACSRMA